MLLLMVILTFSTLLVSKKYINVYLFLCTELPVIDSSSPVFQLLSSVDADPPVFSLSFTVTNRSPTIVTCSVDNGNQFNVSDNDLIRTAATVNNDIQVQVLMIFKMRVSGLYKCFVATDRITTTPLLSAGMAIRNLTCKYYYLIIIILMFFKQLDLHQT